VSELLKYRTDCHFVIVGDGELRTDLEQFSRNLNLQGHVSFIGWRKDLEHVYADLDVLMLTSDNEGTPVSIIEAMAAGVPVVSTSVGGVPDLLQNGQLGRLVVSGSIDQMVQAVLSTLQGPSPGQISEAQEFVLANYGSHRLISDLKTFYLKSLVAKGYDLVRTL
jgi:glycosyltransferase involved in cell wall biosynthesis